MLAWKGRGKGNGVMKRAVIRCCGREEGRGKGEGGRGKGKGERGKGKGGRKG